MGIQFLFIAPALLEQVKKNTEIISHELHNHELFHEDSYHLLILFFFFFSQLFTPYNTQRTIQGRVFVLLN